MSGWGDKYSRYFGSQREEIAKYAWTILLAILKEAGEVALDEFGATLEQYRKERKTPDGWTEEEYLTYAIGRLRLLQERKIGPWVVDEVIDYCIERVVRVLDGKLANIDDDDPDDVEPDVTPAPEPPPVVVTEPEPAPVVPPADSVYYPKVYDPAIEFPNLSALENGDRVYKYIDSSFRFVIKPLWQEMPVIREQIKKATLIYVVQE